MTAKSVRISIAVLLVANSIGCSPDAGRTLEPIEISEDFEAPSHEVVERYRTLWDGEQLTALDRATIAGELARFDHGRRATYERHLFAAITSSDALLRAAAANSLRNVQGAESMAALTEAALSGESRVERSAGHAIRYKQQSAAGGSLPAGERNLVLEASTRLCANQQLAGHVRQLIC